MSQTVPAPAVPAAPAPASLNAPTPAAPIEPALSRVLLAACRSEWTKLRTVRSTIWAFVLTIIFTIGVGGLLTALEVSRWDHRTLSEIKGFDPIFYSFAGLNLAQLSIGVLGVLVMTSEYSTGPSNSRSAPHPNERCCSGAKVATFSAVVAVVSLISCFAAFWICQAILAPKHAGVSIGDPGVLCAVIGGALPLVLIGAIAVGLGAVLRRTAGAVAILFAVLLVLPGLVLLLPSPWKDDITRYLPNSAGAAMSAVVHFPNLLAPAAGFIVLCAYTAATVILAAFTLNRRDAQPRPHLQVAVIGGVDAHRGRPVPVREQTDSRGRRSVGTPSSRVAPGYRRPVCTALVLPTDFGQR